jgi:hypothetical protein
MQLLITSLDDEIRKIMRNISEDIWEVPSMNQNYQLLGHDNWFETYIKPSAGLKIAELKKIQFSTCTQAVNSSILFYVSIALCTQKN